MPTATPAQFSMVPQPAVTATRPARQPFIVLVKSNIYSPLRRSWTYRLTKRAVAAPEAAAREVLTAAKAATRPLYSDAKRMAEPGLKPYPVANHNKRNR